MLLDQVQAGAIIGDGDRKRAPFLVLGLSPWYGTKILFLEQIAPSRAAHGARICCEDFCGCRAGKTLPLLYKSLNSGHLITSFDQATWQHPRENPQLVHGSARIYDVMMAQFVLKIEKFSRIMGARGSQGLRSPSPIMAPGSSHNARSWNLRQAPGRTIPLSPYDVFL